MESVSASAGTPADYAVSSVDGGRTEIKIGDPDTTITGVHTYTIVYTVGAALNGFADHDELYWNAIGDEWDVPIDQASVLVVRPRHDPGRRLLHRRHRARRSSCDAARASGEHGALPPGADGCRTRS